jgi:hypothetical protein
VFFSIVKSKLDHRVPTIFHILVATLSLKSVNKICGHLPPFFKQRNVTHPQQLPMKEDEGKREGRRRHQPLHEVLQMAAGHEHVPLLVPAPTEERRVEEKRKEFICPLS